MVDWPEELRISIRAYKTQKRLGKVVATNIRLYRMRRGLTQRDLAKLLNKPQPSIARLERSSYGRHTLSSLVTLATALRIDVTALFSDVTEELPTPVPSEKKGRDE